MKEIVKGICFFAFLTSELFSVGNNALEDASGYICLSAEQIESLDSWQEGNQAYLGKPKHISGLTVQNNTCLTHICFEEEALSVVEEFVAEGQVKSMGARRF